MVLSDLKQGDKFWNKDKNEEFWIIKEENLVIEAQSLLTGYRHYFLNDIKIVYINNYYIMH